MTKSEIEEMRQTHEDILNYWKYPRMVEEELRQTMADWLGTVRPEKE